MNEGRMYVRPWLGHLVKGVALVTPWVIKDLTRRRQTNFNFAVAYRYTRGETNGPVVAAEMDALVAAH